MPKPCARRLPLRRGSTLRSWWSIRFATSTMMMTLRIHSWTMLSSPYRFGCSTTSATTSSRRAVPGKQPRRSPRSCSARRLRPWRNPSANHHRGARPPACAHGTTGGFGRPLAVGRTHQPTIGGAVARRTAISTEAHGDRRRVASSRARSALSGPRRCLAPGRAAWNGSALASNLHTSARTRKRASPDGQAVSVRDGRARVACSARNAAPVDLTGRLDCRADYLHYPLAACRCLLSSNRRSDPGSQPGATRSDSHVASPLGHDRHQCGAASSSGMIARGSSRR